MKKRVVLVIAILIGGFFVLNVNVMTRQTEGVMGLRGGGGNKNKLFLRPQDDTFEEYAFVHIPKNAGVAIGRTIEKYKLPIKICGHRGAAKCVGKKKAVVVVRNPLTRFASAVKYALTFFSDVPHIREILNENLITPQDWIDVLLHPTRNPKHTNLIMKQMNNNVKKAHRIDGRRTKFKWTYTSQVAWIGSLEQPVILRFEHLEEDWKMFLERNKFSRQATLSDRVTYRGKASQEPSRIPALSPDALQYLKTLYRRDFELYDAVN